MAHYRWRLGVAGMLILVAMAGGAIGQSGKPSDDAKKTADKEKPAGRRLDSLKNLPPGTIIIICDNLQEVQQFRDIIWVREKEYEDLQKELAQLRAKAPTERATPGECHLSGKVEDDLARLHVEFKFMTEKDGEQVVLGFRSGQPTGVTLDGIFPLFRSTNDGLILHVEKKGEHAARLGLEVNLGPMGDRARERGFELDLPGAAVTSLELDLPAGVKEAALGVTRSARTSVYSVSTREEGERRRLVQQLGAATGLVVSWKAPPPRSENAVPYLTAQGRITVRIFEQQVATEAELTLEARGKPVDVWRLRVPPHASVIVKPRSGEERAQAEVKEPNGPVDQLREIHLKEPTTDKVQVTVRVEQKREQSAVAVGPFVVEGARRQSGVILLAAPADARLRVFPRGMVGPRELSAEEQKEFKAAFTYWGAPAAEQPGQPHPPFLEVDAESNRGTIEARVLHTLEKTEHNWKLTTVIDATPLTTGVDQISVQLPPDYRLVSGLAPRSGEPAYSVKINPGGARVADIQLEQKQSRAFRVTLEGTYPPTPDPVRQASFELPQPQQIVAPRGGGHQVTILLPEALELETPKATDPAWEVTRVRPHQQRWSSDQLPTRIEISWQPHRQELLLASVADIAISGHVAQVVQQIWFAAAQAPAEVSFRLPENVRDVHVLEQGEWNGSTRTVVLASQASEKRPLRLRYGFDVNLQGTAAVFPVPLAQPGRGVRCDTKVRIACEPGTLAERAGGPWEELSLEPMGEGDDKRLASLVLHGDRPEMPPVLRLSEAPFQPLATVAVQRALIRVLVTDEGQQRYHVSFLVARAGRHLDIEFPAPPASLNVRVTRGEFDAGWGPIDETSAKPLGGVDVSRIAHVPLGAGIFKPTLVDIWYQTGLGQSAGRGPAWLRTVGPFQTILQPPRICGDTNYAPVRWQVVLPADWIALHENGAVPPEQSWSWRGWLLAARPSASVAEMEHWLHEPGDQETADPDPAVYPSLSSRRTDLDPLQIVHVQQQLWLLGCSLVLLLLGLGLYFLRPGRFVFWLIVLVLGGAALAAGLFWPGVLSTVIYGGEPGLLALLAVLGLQWLLQLRYRRQVAFLPSFKRSKPSGSSFVHNGGVARPRGEPTTVDVLPPSPSSHRSKGA
jgi:hypothetical protein